MEGVEGKDVQGIREDPTIVDARLGLAQFYLGSSVRAPDQSDRRAVARAERRIEAFLTKVNQFFARDWPAYRDVVEDTDLSFFEDREPIRMPESD